MSGQALARAEDKENIDRAEAEAKRCYASGSDAIWGEAGGRSGKGVRLFREGGCLQLFEAAGVYAELHLEDLIEAAIDGRKALIHLALKTLFH